jgi:hypothetical protein
MRQISWQEQDLNIHSQDLNQLAASQLELTRKWSKDWMNRNHKKTLGSHNWTQTGKGIYTRPLCQKNKEYVEVKQRPVKIGLRTIYRTLTPKREPFQTGIDR